MPVLARRNPESPSPRKAWIETSVESVRKPNGEMVAFPPEGVD